MKKYFAYYRRSTDVEDKQVLSLDGQSEIVNDYAIKHDLKIIKEIRESFSAKKEGRPLFNKMVQDIREGKADGIVAYKLDRLTRNYVDLGILSQLINDGFEIHTPSGSFTDNPDNNFMLGLNTCIAKRKIDDLSQDTKRGLKQKANMGWFPGFAPTGYVNDIINKTIEVDLKKTPYTKKIFEWYDTGQYSLNKVCDKLNSLGIKSRNGKKFSKTTIEGIIKNPFYYGYFRYKGELAKGSHKAIISKELWQRVNDRLAGKAQRKDKANKHVYLYRGFLTCAECGCSITAEKQKGHIYYRCTKSKGKCSQSYVREEELEIQLSDMFSDIQISKKVTDYVSKKGIC